jgi:hypothetical protein
MYLPSFFTKRNSYAKFCLEKRGVKITTNNKGSISTTPAVEGVEKLTPSWSAYCTYWNNHYPNLKVRKPTEDICNRCYKFYNSQIFKAADDDVLLLLGEDEDEAALALILTPTKIPIEPSTITNTTTGVEGCGPPAGVDGATNEMEEAILAASLHVKMTRAMRQHVNNKVA